MKTQSELWLDDSHVEYHLRQYRTLYRSTHWLRDFVASVVPDVHRNMDAIDLGCGGGANIYHLGELLDRTQWAGIDLNAHVVSAGKTLLEQAGFGERAKLEVGDLYQLDQLFEPASFDLAFSIQTLSWLPDYEPLVLSHLRLLKPGGVLFVSSLFTDFHVDARIEVTTFDKDQFGAGFGPHFYNIYCFPKFEAFCLKAGVKQVIARDFDIDINLEVPAEMQMGTFTRTLSTGQRMQFSGPLAMPWKFIALKV